MLTMYELWFRAAYEPDLAHRRFTSAVRPGSRLPGEHKGVSEGETVRVRIIAKPGDETSGLLPVFRPFECLIRITGLRVKKLSEITQEDLRFCSEDARDPKTLKYHLGLIYNRVFQDDEPITLLSWEYLKED
jgi:hypothetical protein